MITGIIYELESRAHKIFTEYGYAQNTIRLKMLVIKRILNLHHEQSKQQLCKDIISNYIQHQEIRCQNGEIGRYQFHKCCHTAKQLIQINETGTISKRYRILPPLPNGFEKILFELSESKPLAWSCTNKQNK